MPNGDIVEPIPGEYLFTPHLTTQFRIRTNGIWSVCLTACDVGLQDTTTLSFDELISVSSDLNFICPTGTYDVGLKLCKRCPQSCEDCFVSNDQYCFLCFPQYSLNRTA